MRNNSRHRELMIERFDGRAHMYSIGIGVDVIYDHAIGALEGPTLKELQRAADLLKRQRINPVDRFQAVASCGYLGHYRRNGNHMRLLPDKVSNLDGHGSAA